MRLSFPKYKQRGKTCRGIRLQISPLLAYELWYVPSWFRIDKHRHPNLNIELSTIIADDVALERVNALTGKVDYDYPKFHFWPFKHRTYTIDNYHWHTFITHECPFIFLNREVPTHSGRGNMKSAAQDFELYVEQPKISSK